VEWAPSVQCRRGQVGTKCAHQDCLRGVCRLGTRALCGGDVCAYPCATYTPDHSQARCRVPTAIENRLRSVKGPGSPKNDNRGEVWTRSGGVLVEILERTYTVPGSTGCGMYTRSASALGEDLPLSSGISVPKAQSTNSSAWCRRK
jgi:hypothetical protein